MMVDERQSQGSSVVEINNKFQEALAFVKAARQKPEDQNCSKGALNALSAYKAYLNGLENEVCTHASFLNVPIYIDHLMTKKAS